MHTDVAINLEQKTILLIGVDKSVALITKGAPGFGMLVGPKMDYNIVKMVLLASICRENWCFLTSCCRHLRINGQRWHNCRYSVHN